MLLIFAISFSSLHKVSIIFSCISSAILFRFWFHVGTFASETLGLIDDNAFSISGFISLDMYVNAFLTLASSPLDLAGGIPMSFVLKRFSRQKLYLVQDKMLSP